MISQVPERVQNFKNGIQTVSEPVSDSCNTAEALRVFFNATMLNGNEKYFGLAEAFSCIVYLCIKTDKQEISAAKIILVFLQKIYAQSCWSKTCVRAEDSAKVS